MLAVLSQVVPTLDYHTGLPVNRTAFSLKNALMRPRGGATSLLAAPHASTGIVLSPVVPTPNHYNWSISRAIAHHPRQERSSRTKRGRHSAPNRTSDMPSLDKLCVRCSRARARLLLHAHRWPADRTGFMLKNGLAEPSGGATSLRIPHQR